MNVFEAVKQSVTTRQAAEFYGNKPNRAGMIVCPFHNDRTPSMKVDKRFHCFGCGADGDVIDFVARLFGKGAKEAAEMIATDFAIAYENRSRVSPPQRAVRQKSDAEKYKEAENKCFRVLSDYFHLLNRWETEYAPQLEDEQWHPLFVEALQKKSYVEYLLDILVFGEITEKASLVVGHGKEVLNLEKRLSGLTAGAERNGQSGSQLYGAGQEHRRSPGRSGIDR